MAEIFGSKWTGTQPATPTDGWLLALDGLSPADVGTGLLALRDSGTEWPPSATEFRRMCKPKSREHSAMYHCPENLIEHKLSDEQKQQGRDKLAEMKRGLGA